MMYCITMRDISIASNVVADTLSPPIYYVASLSVLLMPASIYSSYSSWKIFITAVMSYRGVSKDSGDQMKQFLNCI